MLCPACGGYLALPASRALETIGRPASPRSVSSTDGCMRWRALLLPAPLPVGEGLVPEAAPGLDHREHLLLLLSVGIRTEAKHRLIHTIQRIKCSFDKRTPILNSSHDRDRN